MREHTAGIISVLEAANMDWSGTFETALYIGAWKFDLRIEEKDGYTEIEAVLPPTISEGRSQRVTEAINDANASTPCGAFFLNGRTDRVVFRLNDLNVDSSADLRRMAAIISYVRGVLECRGVAICEIAEMTAMKRVRRFWDQIFA